MVDFSIKNLEHSRRSNMRKIKFISLGLVVLIFFSVLAGCSCNKYNAVMYSQSKEWILQSFLDENRVRGVFYVDPDAIVGPDGPQGYTDKTSPSERIFIIDNQDTFNDIFKENTLTVDFEKEIVYLYIFNDCSPRKYFIKNIKIEGEQLYIYYRLERRYDGRRDSVEPYQRCLTVVMEKTDTVSVEFIEKD